MNNGHTLPPPGRPGRTSPAAAIEGETSLYRTIRVLRRRGWLLLLVWGSVISIGGAYAVTRPMSYRSDASIEVGTDTPTSAADLFGEFSGRTSPPWENHFRTQQSLLRRPGLLKAVLDALPPESAQEYRASPDPVRKLAQRLEIEAVPSTFLIRISLEHREPGHGPEIVNKLVELYIEDSNRRLRELKSGALEVLSQETLPEIRRKVEESEQRVQAFEVKSGFGDITERYATLLESKRRVAERLFAVRMRRIALRSQPKPRAEDLGDSAIAASSTAAGLEGAPRSLESLAARRSELEVELARQKTILKDKHATIVALREQLAAVNKLIQSALEAAAKSREAALQSAIRKVELELAAADEEEESLAKEETRLNDEIAFARAQEAQYRKLDAELAASRDLYNSYLKRQVEVKAMSGAGVAGVRVVDLAKAPVKSPGNTRLILTLGAIVGLLLGAAAVLIVEQHDDRVTTPQEAESALGLDLLVSIPRLPVSRGDKDGPLVPEDDAVHSHLEPFRRLRSEVAARLQGIAGSKVVAVVGPAYGEGKSTVAVNLARTLGMEGHRVLLFDADIRRPRLKAFFGDVNAPGLETYLRTADSLRRCVQPTYMPGVDVLGASHWMDGSSELPGRARFRELWSEARSYDYVIVDAGPVNAFSEVAGIASQSDASILVMDEHRSGIRQVGSARRILENHEVRILGLVVNRSLAPSAGGRESRGILGGLNMGNGRKKTVGVG